MDTEKTEGYGDGYEKDTIRQDKIRRRNPTI